MTFDERIDGLNPQRRKIVFLFHEMKASQPNAKKFALLQRVSSRAGYSLDRQNRCSSYVVKVIREWESGR